MTETNSRIKANASSSAAATPNVRNYLAVTSNSPPARQGQLKPSHQPTAATMRGKNQAVIVGPNEAVLTALMHAMRSVCPLDLTHRTGGSVFGQPDGQIRVEFSIVRRHPGRSDQGKAIRLEPIRRLVPQAANSAGSRAGQARVIAANAPANAEDRAYSAQSTLLPAVDHGRARSPRKTTHRAGWHSAWP
jgi:hypothetical protein